jgi:hypothetical protein
MESVQASLLLDINDTSQQDSRRIVRLHCLLQDLDPRPCPYGPDRAHPTPSHARRLSRYRRNLLAGVRIAKARLRRVDYLVLTLRYEKSSGVLSANLKESVNRFVQLLRRMNYSFEYFRVVEPTAAGVVNHANLVIRWNEDPRWNSPDVLVRMKGRLVFSPRLVSALWNRATLGTSSVVYSQPVELDGSDTWKGTPEGLVSYLSKYLSKSIGDSGSNYVSHSRSWLPQGSTGKWKNLFVEYAVRYCCDRGFWHTDVSAVLPRWLSWVVWHYDDRDIFQSHQSVPKKA